MNKLFALVTIICATWICVRGQATSPPPQKPDEDSILRVTTNLIQIDASVTDKNHKPVPTLTENDFEVLVNGKPQKITTFAFIGSDLAPVETRKNTAKPDANIPPIPNARLRPEQVKRTIAVVVDDLGMSPGDIYYARRALKNFVDSQMQTGDLVAVIMTGRGRGVLERFTSDKRELNATIENIRYNLNSNGFGPSLESLLKSDEPGPLNEIGQGIQKSGGDEDFAYDMNVNASLAATDYVVRGMRDLPGRKAVMLISPGFPLVLRDHPEYSVRIREAVKRLVDDATRAGVVISTMDSRGLLTVTVGVGPNANSSQIADAYRAQLDAINGPQDGLKYLANQTGGLAILNANDLKYGIREVLDDLRSYYSIGFQPDAGLLNSPGYKFNELKVVVKVPGVNVRYRSGFYGVADRIRDKAAPTAEQQTVLALASPFAASDLDIRLTPLFTYDPKAGPMIRSLVHISTNNFSFLDKPNGGHEAVINIVASTFDSLGVIVDSVGETHRLSLPDEFYRRALKSGFVYSVNVPLKKSGSYQLRVAVRDANTAKLGSASQFINVPDVRKGRFGLSGIALSSYDPRAEDKSVTGDNSPAPAGDSILTKASERRFRPGEVLQFAYSIYNAKVEKTSGQTHLVTAIKLFRDGQEIYTGKETPFDPKGQPDLARLTAQGSLQLGSLAPGEYVLQVIVRDLSLAGKNNTATTWMDFQLK